MSAGSHGPALSKVSAMMTVALSSRCKDCGMDTMPCTGKRGDRHKERWEYYMVHDKLWASKFSEFVIYRTAKLVWRGHLT